MRLPVIFLFAVALLLSVACGKPAEKPVKRTEAAVMQREQPAADPAPADAQAALETAKQDVRDRRARLLADIDGWKRKASEIETLIAEMEERLAARRKLVAEQERILAEVRTTIANLEKMRDSETLDPSQLASVRETIDESRRTLRRMEEKTAEHRHEIDEMQREIDEGRRSVAAKRIDISRMEYRLRSYEVP